MTVCCNRLRRSADNVPEGRSLFRAGVPLHSVAFALSVRGIGVRTSGSVDMKQGNQSEASGDKHTD